MLDLVPLPDLTDEILAISSLCSPFDRTLSHQLSLQFAENMNKIKDCVGKQHAKISILLPLLCNAYDDHEVYVNKLTQCVNDTKTTLVIIERTESDEATYRKRVRASLTHLISPKRQVLDSLKESQCMFVFGNELNMQLIKTFITDEHFAENEIIQLM